MKLPSIITLKKVQIALKPIKTSQYHKNKYANRFTGKFEHLKHYVSTFSFDKNLEILEKVRILRFTTTGCLVPVVWDLDSRKCATRVRCCMAMVGRTRLAVSKFRHIMAVWYSSKDRSSEKQRRLRWFQKGLHPSEKKKVKINRSLKSLKFQSWQK